MGCLFLLRASSVVAAAAISFVLLGDLELLMFGIRRCSNGKDLWNDQMAVLVG